MHFSVDLVNEYYYILLNPIFFLLALLSLMLCLNDVLVYICKILLLTNTISTLSTGREKICRSLDLIADMKKSQF